MNQIFNNSIGPTCWVFMLFPGLIAPIQQLCYFSVLFFCFYFPVYTVHCKLLRHVKNLFTVYREKWENIRLLKFERRETLTFIYLIAGKRCFPASSLVYISPLNIRITGSIEY